MDAIVIIVFRANGNTIFINVTPGLHPSTIAASTSSSEQNHRNLQTSSQPEEEQIQPVVKSVKNLYSRFPFYYRK